MISFYVLLPCEFRKYIWVLFAQGHTNTRRLIAINLWLAGWVWTWYGWLVSTSRFIDVISWHRGCSSTSKESLGTPCWTMRDSSVISINTRLSSVYIYNNIYIYIRLYCTPMQYIQVDLYRSILFRSKSLRHIAQLGLALHKRHCAVNQKWSWNCTSKTDDRIQTSYWHCESKVFSVL